MVQVPDAFQPVMVAQSELDTSCEARLVQAMTAIRILWQQLQGVKQHHTAELQQHAAALAAAHDQHAVERACTSQRMAALEADRMRLRDATRGPASQLQAKQDEADWYLQRLEQCTQQLQQLQATHSSTVVQLQQLHATHSSTVLQLQELHAVHSSTVAELQELQARYSSKVMQMQLLEEWSDMIIQRMEQEHDEWVEKAVCSNEEFHQTLTCQLQSLQEQHDQDKAQWQQELAQMQQAYQQQARQQLQLQAALQRAQHVAATRCHVAHQAVPAIEAPRVQHAPHVQAQQQLLPTRTRHTQGLVLQQVVAEAKLPLQQVVSRSTAVVRPLPLPVDAVCHAHALPPPPSACAGAHGRTQASVCVPGSGVQPATCKPAASMQFVLAKLALGRVYS